MTDPTLQHWLDKLQRAHPTEIELGLERVASVWAHLANSLGVSAQQPFADAKLISVAGTNGKGSTVAALESLARGFGLRVGCYTSPHLLRFNERIRLDGEQIEDAPLVAALEQVDRARGDVSLTFFEHTTLAALLVFARQPLDLVVLEVGLGGRLDAVNIVDADVAVLTSIDLDHQSFLGNSREAIAVEKLAIARAGRPLVIGERDYPVGFVEAVAATAAEPLWLGSDFAVAEESSECWSYRDNQLSIDKILRTSLLPQNLGIATAAYRQLELPFAAERVAALLAQASVAGRQQWVRYRDRELLLDVAHNPASCQQLAALLAASGRPAVAVASAFADKDFAGMVAPLQPWLEGWWLAPIADNPRAADAHKLAQLLYNDALIVTVCDSLPAALQSALEHSPPDRLVVVLGSFMVVAEILTEIAEGVA